MIQIIHELERIVGDGILAPQTDRTVLHHPQVGLDERRAIVETDFDREDALARFAMRLPSYAEVLGLDPAEVATVRRDATAFRWAVDTQERYKCFVHDRAVYIKRLAEGCGGGDFEPPSPPELSGSPICTPGIFRRLRDLIHRIKNDPVYSLEMGRDLGIADTTWLEVVTTSALESH